MSIVDLDTIARDLRDPSLQLEAEIDGREITESTSLQQDLQMDSLAVMDFLTFLEEKYGVSVTDDSLGSVESIGDIITLVNGLVETQ
ncbi:acyl carrier protein [Spirillospora albida]|uniref:acyl carrier protein n=1 Tax=Spirillospora albida TaxID=58123 RepID=UPI00055F9C1D|nr:acyl carrier protein [Spirillospora albida]